jgi:hypothetical protein
MTKIYACAEEMVMVGAARPTGIVVGRSRKATLSNETGGEKLCGTQRTLLCHDCGLRYDGTSRADNPRRQADRVSPRVVPLSTSFRCASRA